MRQVDSTDHDKTSPSTITYTAEEFMAEYNQLCLRTGMMIRAEPSFAARDDGTFSVVVRVSVQPLPVPLRERLGASRMP